MILSHDLGTTGDKAALVDADGSIVAAATAAYDTDFGPRGKAEQDPGAWWRALCRATRQLLEARPGAAAAVEGVCFSGQMMGAVLLDAARAPVRPAIIWADTRSTSQSEQLVQRVGMGAGYRITGHRLNATYSLSKVMWVREHEPEVFARVRHVVQAKDLMVARLTGEVVTDPSDASSTNAFDQRSGTWSGELLGAAGLPADLFPEIVPSTTVVGRVGREAAAASGLLAGTPVVLGGGDGPTGALGAGIVDAASGAYAYLGSSSWISLAADAPLHDPLMRTMTFNHVVPGRYVPTATMQAGGASLQWVVDLLDPGGDSRYERLLGAAAGVRASEDGLYFLPHLLGERSPYWNPRARAVFAGLARHHGPEHLTRAVVEGVAFNLRTGLKAFVDNGAAVERIDAIGGAANSPDLLRVLADVWGVPVRRLDLVDEATAVGAAVVGGVGVGVHRDFTRAVRPGAHGAELTPDAAAHARYRGEHEVFLDAYRRLEPWFETL
ncbi:xylulokinase [Kineococcus indalonis]|uniref:xylulokinase n=1 Tax=Kineococcus indalonis TaxID=2696566 RepID=UPI00141301F5|nr:FGGY family carbohydrate kinase [Kineococcus indalonis]NAZ87845.1 xylulokinase [Kineococcus indalonis]